MFESILVPVDLEHQTGLERALQLAADMARQHSASITYVGVTAPSPTPLAHTPKEFAARLAAFAEEQAAAHGVTAKAHAMVAHDPATEVDDALLRAVDEVGADLVIMATHRPGAIEYIWPSNGGKIAEHAKCSVFLVRG